MNRIDALFDRLKRAGRPALMPFLTAGDPDLETTASLVTHFLDRGANLIELGIPYSDPIADGPVIAASYARALARGAKLDSIFSMVQSLRLEVDAPLVAMVSYSIIHRRGTELFAQAASAAGFDGLIVPDLPVEEAESMLQVAGENGLKLVQLITPRTPRDRALAIARTSSGFLYYVSVAGITGERTEFPPDLVDNLAWLRSQTNLPICVGFGISAPAQVRALAPYADGLIVGSAIVRRVEQAADRGQRGELLASNLGSFVAEMADALSAGSTEGGAGGPSLPSDHTSKV